MNKQALIHSDLTHSSPELNDIINNNEIIEASILELQKMMEAKQLSAKQLVEIYLQRIYAYDRAGPRINSILEINPDALSIADELDKERKKNGPRSLLHGIPVILKDVIATADKLRTSNGSYLFLDATPTQDASVVKKLREAGAIILAKANMDELACCNGVASGRGGAVRSPYLLERFANGSSSGAAAAIAANFGVFSLGTDTGSSIRFPASAAALVGLKPTMGLISRAGIIPTDIHLDVIGPITRTIEDAAIVTSILAFEDEKDINTQLKERPKKLDYWSLLNKKKPHSARIGIARKGYFGFHAGIDAAIEKNIVLLEQLGYTLVDAIELSSIEYADGNAEDAAILLASSRWAIDQYFKSLSEDSPIRSFDQFVAATWLAALPTGLSIGQSLPNWFTVKKKDKNPHQYPVHHPEVQAAFKRFISKQRNQVTAIMNCLDLDAIIYPTVSNFSNKIIPNLTPDEQFSMSRGQPELANYGGLPEITVPAGYTKEGYPVGLSFLGRPFSEEVLFSLAYHFEQATLHRKPPNLSKFPPSLNVKLPDIPKNNLFKNKIILKGNEGEITGNLLRATIQDFEPRINTNIIDRTVWFSLTALKNGTLKICLDHSSTRKYDLGIFQGTDLKKLVKKQSKSWSRQSRNTELVVDIEKDLNYCIVIGANMKSVSSGFYKLNWKIST